MAAKKRTVLMREELDRQIKEKNQRKQRERDEDHQYELL